MHISKQCLPNRLPNCNYIPHAKVFCNAYTYVHTCVFYICMYIIYMQYIRMYKLYYTTSRVSLLLHNAKVKQSVNNYKCSVI